MQIHRRILLRAAAAAAAGFAVAGRPAFALDKPAGPVVLTVWGSVATPNDGAQAQFDMAMLQALPQASFTMHTPWYVQPRKFTGPLVRDVLAAAGARGSLLRAEALNDYRVEIPWEDVERHDVIVARLLDDRPMAVRDKGPLFVVYPFDAEPELRNQKYFNRSVWQLRRIEVR